MAYSDDSELDLFAAQVRARPTLALDEVARLLAQSRAEPGGDASRRLVEHHLAVALDAALARRTPALEFGDLFQEGTVALTVAVAEYAGRDGRAGGLRSFLTKVVASRLDNAVTAAEASRQADLALVADAEAYERADFALRRELGRKPTALELAAHLEWPLDRLEGVSQAVGTARQLWDEEVVLYLDDNDDSAG